MEHAIGVAATGFGLLVRWILVLVQKLVELIPVAMVVYGAYLIYVPIAWILTGLILGLPLYLPRVTR